MTLSLPPFSAGHALPECRIHITQELIDEYARISGDFNPIHVDAQAGAASVFGGTIAHGCIPLEPVFQSILRWSGGDRLPPQTRLSLRYRAPSRPGDTIHSRVRLQSESATAQARAIVMAFSCVNQNGQLVIDGECTYPA